MPFIQRWIYAVKIGSWPKILVPACLGITLGWLYQPLTTTDMLIMTSLMLFLVLAIVLCNDWADVDVDSIKRQMYPEGCSPKTIPDHILSLGAVRLAACLACGLFLVVGIGAARHQPGTISLIIIAILFIQTYSFKPFCLNYRGGGEWLEAIGVGVLLPLLFQSFLCEDITTPESLVLLGSFPTAFASALASGLADEESDRKGGKSTYTTRYGQNWVASKILLSLDIATFLWIIFAFYIQWWPPLIGAFFLFCIRYRLHTLSASVQTAHFHALKSFKNTLHFQIWGAHILMIIAIIMESMVAR